MPSQGGRVSKGDVIVDLCSAVERLPVPRPGTKGGVTAAGQGRAGQGSGAKQHHELW